MEYDWYKGKVTSCIRVRIKGFLSRVFESTKSWNSFIHYSMFCSVIDNYYNGARIIKIGSVLIEKVDVEVSLKPLIPPWKIFI